MPDARLPGQQQRTAKFNVPPTPLCFDSDVQWREWIRAARDSKEAGNLTFSYCTDCIPEYKRLMLLAGRCSYPRTVFAMKRQLDDYEIVGYRRRDRVPVDAEVVA